MVFSNLLAKESLVGVDIGSSSIKVVQAEPTKQGAHISHVAICPTPPNCTKEGTVTSSREVADAIQFAMRSAGIKASSAVVAIAGPGVIVRQVKVPKMTEELLRKSIYFEAGKYISASIEDSVVEFEILGDAEEEDQMNICLVAAPKAMVDSKVAAVEAAGLEPYAVDVEAFAVLRSLIEFGNQPELKNSTVGLLDMGASHTEINLVSRGNLALSRNIPVAGSSLTSAIMNANGCSDADAEQMKQALDLNALLDPVGQPSADPSLKAVQPLVDELLREIRRSINYYQSQLPDGMADSSIDALVLTGGTARLKGLSEYTNSRLNVAVSVGGEGFDQMIDPAVLSSRISGEDVPLLAVAFGLALKEITPAAVSAAA